MANNQNLRPWKKGQSGNPYGRIPNARIPRYVSDAYAEVLVEVVPDCLLKGRLKNLQGTGITFAELCARSAVLIAAIPGRDKRAGIAALKEITDRTEGKQTVEANVNVHHTIEYTPEQRRQELAELGVVIDAEFEDVIDTPLLTDGTNDEDACVGVAEDAVNPPREVVAQCTPVTKNRGGASGSSPRS